MKRHNNILLAVIACLLVSSSLFGQAQINTRREKLKNFTSSITKVVLTGDEVLDEALRESVSSRWSLSPYEFCTLQEFDKLKADPSYYFLMIVKQQSGKENEAGIKVLTLVKGGDGAQEGIGKMLEVVSFPFSSAQEPSGRELTVLPAMLEIIQKHTSRLTDTEMKAYSDLKIYNKNFPRLWNKQIYLSVDDLSPEISEKTKASLDEDIFIKNDEAVDSVFNNSTYNAAVSFVVAPNEPENGSYCYKMIFGADNHILYYFKKHRITSRNGAGFSPSDINELRSIRKNKK